MTGLCCVTASPGMTPGSAVTVTDTVRQGIMCCQIELFSMSTVVYTTVVYLIMCTVYCRLYSFILYSRAARFISYSPCLHKTPFPIPCVVCVYVPCADGAMQKRMRMNHQKDCQLLFRFEVLAIRDMWNVHKISFENIFKNKPASRPLQSISCDVRLDVFLSFCLSPSSMNQVD